MVICCRFLRCCDAVSLQHDSTFSLMAHTATSARHIFIAALALTVGSMIYVDRPAGN